MISLRSLLSAAVLVTVTPLAVTAAQSEDYQPDKIKLTALPSEGIMIQFGDMGILIDAFVDPHETEGDSLLTAVRQNLIIGRPPFSNIQLALVSHPHHEHFHPATAREFLNNHDGVSLASSPDIIEAIQAEYDSDQPIQKQLIPLSIEMGKITSETIAEIKVYIVPFPHEASMLYPEQVLGHIIQLGDKKILYTSDSEMLRDNWKPYNLKALKINIAVIPYWLYSSENTRKIIDEHVSPHRIVVLGVPPAGRIKPADEQEQDYPDNVVILSNVMDTIEF